MKYMGLRCVLQHARQRQSSKLPYGASLDGNTAHAFGKVAYVVQ
jgi:hypothetical protein